MRRGPSHTHRSDPSQGCVGPTALLADGHKALAGIGACAEGVIPSCQQTATAAGGEGGSAAQAHPPAPPPTWRAAQQQQLLFRGLCPGFAAPAALQLLPCLPCQVALPGGQPGGDLPVDALAAHQVPEALGRVLVHPQACGLLLLRGASLCVPGCHGEQHHDQMGCQHPCGALSAAEPWRQHTAASGPVRPAAPGAWREWQHKLASARLAESGPCACRRRPAGAPRRAGLPRSARPLWPPAAPTGAAPAGSQPCTGSSERLGGPRAARHLSFGRGAHGSRGAAAAMPCPLTF